MRAALKAGLHDLCLAALAGGCVAAAALVVLTLVGTALNGFQLRQGLVVARGGLLVLGSLSLFVCAGLLIRPQSGQKLTERPAWRERFRLFGLMPVLAVAAIVLILTASVLDYGLYFA